MEHETIPKRTKRAPSGNRKKTKRRKKSGWSDEEHTDELRIRWVLNECRRFSHKYPPISNALKKVRIDKGRYLCTMCNKVFKAGDFERDHEPPVYLPGGDNSLGARVERMFCHPDNIRPICKLCHRKKTKEQLY